MGIQSNHPGNAKNLTPGGPGRPKGSKNKPKLELIRDKAYAAAKAQVSGLIARSLDQLDRDLDATTEVERRDASGAVIGTEIQPDWQVRRDTARFLISKLGAPSAEKTYIETKLSGVLNSYEDIGQLSQEAILMAMDGLMSFEQVEHLQKLLMAHATIQGYVELKDLREELERLANMRTVSGERVIPEESRITWGKGVNAPGNTPERPAE